MQSEKQKLNQFKLKRGNIRRRKMRVSKKNMFKSIRLLSHLMNLRIYEVMNTQIKNDDVQLRINEVISK